MPIEVVWDDDAQTMVRMDFTVGWDFNEFTQAMQQVFQKIEQRDGAVLGVIVDISRDTIPPMGAMPHFKRAIEGEGDEPVVFVRDEMMTRRLFQALKQVYGIKRPVHFVDTLDEARALIRDNATQRNDTNSI